MFGGVASVHKHVTMPPEHFVVADDGQSCATTKPISVIARSRASSIAPSVILPNTGKRDSADWSRRALTLGLGRSTHTHTHCEIKRWEGRLLEDWPTRGVLDTHCRNEGGGDC